MYVLSSFVFWIHFGNDIYRSALMIQCDLCTYWVYMKYTPLFCWICSSLLNNNLYVKDAAFDRKKVN